MILAGTAAAASGWQLKDGAAVAAPSETNSTIVRMMLHCDDGPLISVHAADGGPIRPAAPGPLYDYFDTPGFVRADVDGEHFPLVAAGSGGAVTLFSEGSVAQNYVAPIDIALIKAMRAGKLFTLRFNLTPAYSTDSSAFETIARFALTGAAAPIKQAVKGCL